MKNLILFARKRGGNTMADKLAAQDYGCLQQPGRCI